MMKFKRSFYRYKNQHS
ncbi:hypothetical protein HPF67_0656, partial [Helicobacter pylori]